MGQDFLVGHRHTLNSLGNKCVSVHAVSNIANQSQLNQILDVKQFLPGNHPELVILHRTNNVIFHLFGLVKNIMIAFKIQLGHGVPQKWMEKENILIKSGEFVTKNVPCLTDLNPNALLMA